MYRCLQVAIHISIFLEVAKQNKYTYKGSSNKSLFFHKTFCQSHTTCIPVISSHECTTEIYHFSNNNGFIMLMSVCSTFPVWCQLVLRNAVWCDIPQNKGYHITPCGILDTFLLLFLFIVDHAQHPILFASKSQCLFLVSSLFNWLLDGLVFLSLWSEFAAPSLSFVYVPHYQSEQFMW